MIENPSYLYGSYEIPSPTDGSLFHYTKLDNFLMWYLYSRIFFSISTKKG